MRFFIFIFSVLFYFWVQQAANLAFGEAFSIALLIYFVLQFISNLGHKIIILDLTIIIGIFTCLVLPVYFYHNYTRQNALASKWVKYMFVPSAEYFSFTLPAVIAMIFGMKIPLWFSNKQFNPTELLINLSNYLKGNARMGFILIGLGLTSSFIFPLVPEAFIQFFYFGKQLVYVGMLYIYFSDYKFRKLVLILTLILAIGSAIASALFGELIFMFALALIIILLNQKVSFVKKLTFFFVGIFLVLVIQTVKMDFRKKAWRGEGDAGAVYFTELVINTINTPSAMYSEIQLFRTAVRLNQGWLVARTLYHVPKQFPFADGETIWKSIAATIVPRFLWPDKPEAGGKENLKRFWGYSLRGFSMNIGPLGEGYGNFGRTGGIIFMFFYGLFFNFMLSWLIEKSKFHSTLICWLPFLFLYTIGLETDIMTTMNSLIKGFVFMYVVFWSFKRFFDIRL